MKAFINLLVSSENYDTPDQIEDIVLAVLEQEQDFKVLWHKSSEAKDRDK